MFSLIQDRRGRFSPLRAATLAILLMPGLRLLFRWLTSDLGGRPVMEVTHVLGDWTIYFLLASLAITPLRSVLDWQKILPLRRMIGVAAGCYATLHLSMFVIDQKFDLVKVATEIVLRFYLTIGFATFLGLLALAITSTDGWMKRLGRRWKKLHRIAYPLAVLGLFHYFLQSKADVSAAVFVTGLFVWEMIWRGAPRAARLMWWPLPVMAVAAGIVTALLEASWYGLATKIDPLRVLQANLDFGYALRPGVMITICGIALSCVAAATRWRQRRAVVVA